MYRRTKLGNVCRLKTSTLRSYRRKAYVLILMLPALACAQPDAGALLQQIEQGQQQALPEKAHSAEPVVPSPMQATGGLTITVTSFRFAGNTLINAERLTPMVAAYLNRPLGLAELNQAAAAVADYYRASGWVVRAFLPQQEIKEGSVTIQIVEAVFGGAVIEGSSPGHLPVAAALRIVESAQQIGEKLNANAVDRGLLLLGDTPGISATGNLRSGKVEGETDLALKLADTPLLRGDAGIDNSGSRSTGAERLLTNAVMNGAMGKGDQATTNIMHTRGSDYISIGGTLPLGSNGWRAGINTSYMRYHLVAAEFDAIDGNGTSATFGVEASYPLIRMRAKNLYFNARADRKNFDNYALAAVTSHYRTDALTLGLTGNLFDNFHGGGANSASLFFVSGIVNLNDSPNQVADATSANSAGHFTKIRYAANRQQALTETLSFYAALTGQMALQNLDGSEKFYLGGAGGVRAYPSSEGGGSEGQMLNMELRWIVPEGRWKMPRGLMLATFYDWGRVRVNRDNNFSGAPALNSYDLKGAGLGLTWQADTGLTAKLIWARRMGENPNPATTGQDQDGSFVRDRLWLSITQPF